MPTTERRTIALIQREPGADDHRLVLQKGDTSSTEGYVLMEGLTFHAGTRLFGRLLRDDWGWLRQTLPEPWRVLPDLDFTAGHRGSMEVVLPSREGGWPL